jgi:hypothetical protein
MRIDRHVEVKAQDGSMTLGELRAFVAELDQAGAAETTTIEGTVRWGGGVKSLKATAERFGDPEEAHHSG